MKSPGGLSCLFLFLENTILKSNNLLDMSGKHQILLFSALVFVIGLGFMLPRDNSDELVPTADDEAQLPETKKRKRTQLTVPDQRREATSGHRGIFEVPESLRSQMTQLNGLEAEDTRRGTAIIELSRAWAKIDAEAAFAWAASLEQSESLLASKMVALEISKASPAEAFETIRHLEKVSPQLFESSQFVALDHWSREDFEAAWQACETLGDMDFRNRMRKHLLVENSATDPVSSAKVFEQLDFSEAADGSFDGVAASIARGLAREAPVGSNADDGENGQSERLPPSSGGVNPGVEWALSLPAKGRSRTAALSGAVGDWTISDPEAASKWLLEYPSGKERDAVIEEMTALAHAPDISFVWATDAMTEGPTKQRVLLRSATTWLANDPEAAKKAIDTSANLTESDRDLIYKHWDEAVAPFLTE